MRGGADAQKRPAARASSANIWLSIYALRVVFSFCGLLGFGYTAPRCGTACTAI